MVPPYNGSPSQGAVESFRRRKKALRVLACIPGAFDTRRPAVWGKTLGRHKIGPNVSPNKTWEGFLGGIATATLLGAALWWVTPFTPLQSAAMSLLITFMGFAGGLVMSAIKRDRGVKDYGTMLGGHGGVMDRIDSICFAAPISYA